MTSEQPSSVARPSTRHNDPTPFAGHNGCINAVCYSPDGRRIATGGRHPRIRIWDSNTGEMLFEVEDDTVKLRDVTSLCYSSDGKRLVSGDEHDMICIWSVSDRGLVLKYAEPHSCVTTITYAPGGQHMASGGCDNRVRIWHAENMTQMMVSTQHPRGITSVSLSPNGRHLASGSWDSKIRILDVATGALVMSPLQGHTDVVRAVVYSPDGTQLASCSDDCTIRVWDASTGAILLGPLEGHCDAVRCLSYSPDGKRLLSGSRDKTIQVWNSNMGKLVGGPVRGHHGDVTAVSYAPDGTCFVTGSEDGTMRIWDAWTQEVVPPGLTKDEKEVFQLAGPFRGHTGRIRAVAYFPDGNFMASASDDGSIRIWDVRTGEQVGRVLIGGWTEVVSIAISSDGGKLVSGGLDCMIRVWDNRTGRVDLVGPLKGHSDVVLCMQFSPNDRFIATSDKAGQLFLWSVQAGKWLGSFRAHGSWIWALSFSADGSQLTGAGNDICVWDVSTMGLVAGPFGGWHTGPIQSVAFSPDGLCIVSGSGDGTVLVWDAKTGTLLFRPLSLPLSGPLNPHSCHATFVSYSPDGTKICSNFYGTIYLWHVTAGDLIPVAMRGHKGAIMSAAFSPNGRYIVTGSEDCAIEFLDVASGEIVQFPVNSADDLAEENPLLERLDRPLDLTEKIRRLGKNRHAGGSFGDVHKCLYDSPSGRFEVAVKALRFSVMSGDDVDNTASGTLPKPVHRELGIWRRLNHQNIVPFLGIASGFGPYTALVSMWMSNGTLQNFLKNHDDRLSVNMRFRILQDIIYGLQYLHARYVVHGDLTPSNILIDDDFRARLTDFGFSSAIGNLPSCLAYLQRSTLRPGAIRWAAPEKMLQEGSMTRLTTKSDIYSFGCIMLQAGNRTFTLLFDVPNMRSERYFPGNNPGQGSMTLRSLRTCSTAKLLRDHHLALSMTNIGPLSKDVSCILVDDRGRDK